MDTNVTFVTISDVTISDRIGYEAHVRRTNDWLSRSLDLSLYLNTLHLSKSQMEGLTDRIMGLVRCAEVNTYCQGVVAGMQYVIPGFKEG